MTEDRIPSRSSGAARVESSTRRTFLGVGALTAAALSTPRALAAAESGLRSRPLFSVVADIAPPHDMGDRQVYAVLGGSFEGDRLRGRVLEGGGDWALTRGDVTTLDVRVTLQTDDGALIYTHYLGRVRQTAEGLYFRTTPYFETASEKYDWLNGIVAVGVRSPSPAGKVAYEVWEIL